MNFRRILLPALGMFCAVSASGQPHADLLVYSGSPAGVMAAVAAARNGLSVVLVDMNSHIGGVVAGGLIDSDVGEASTISGLPAEFFRRVEDYYIKHYGRDSREHLRCKGGYHFEPGVAELIFREMLAEQKISIWEKHRFLSLTRDDRGNIRSVTMEDLRNKGTTRTFHADYFIDASYEGDLMAAAGVPWTYGREPRSAYGEVLAGIAADSDKSKIGSGDHRTMSYNYRMTLTNKPGNTVPFHKPEHYDPTPFEEGFTVIKNLIKRGKRKRFVECFANGEKRANPNEKYDANWADFAESSENYAVSDWPTREKIADRIKQRSQSLLYWYASNPEFPKAFREDVARWGYAKDEYTDNGHFPFQLYVREARRMVGLHVLTQQDITQQRFQPTGIAVGSYGIDCKVVRWVEMDGRRTLDNTRHYVPAPYDIPYGTLCPPDQPGQPGNLLVPVCCSASHVAYCSLRMEPVYMMLGHASGTAIALASRQGCALQKLDPQQLREQLRREHMELDNNYLPLVAIEHKPENPMPSEKVTFSIKLLHPLRDPIKNIYWDLQGDGSVTARTATVTHTFSQSKIYHISLIVEDTAGRRRMLSMPLPVGDAGERDIVLDDAETLMGKGRISGRMISYVPRGILSNRHLFYGPGFLRSRYRTKASICYDIETLPAGRYRLVHGQSADPKNVSQATLSLSIGGKPEKAFTLRQREAVSPFPLAPAAEFTMEKSGAVSILLDSPNNDGYLVSDGIRLLYLGPPPTDATAAVSRRGRLPVISETGGQKKDYGVFRDRPLTEIRPEGWLRQFFQRHRDGLGTHYAESGFPFNTGLWVGLIKPAAWSRYEQSAFLLDGIHRAAVILGDEAWQQIGRANVRYVLSHPQADGKLGKTPAEMALAKESGFSPAQWPFAVFSRVIMSEYDATRDPEILQALTRHYLALPDDIGRFARDGANIEGMVWLYSKTRDPRILRKAISSYKHFEKNNRSRSREKLLGKSPMIGHSAVNAEMIVIPINLYLYTGDRSLLEAGEAAVEVLNRDHLLPSYTISSAEELSGQAPEHVHELCAQVDYTWALQKLFLATGKVAYADQIEKSVYNAGFGSISKDFKSHQYFSAANQAISTQSSSGITKFGKANLNRQAYRPGHTVQCCSGSVHRILPNFAGQLWVSDENHAIVAAFYAPNTLSTTLPDGQSINIHEETRYPFDGNINFRIECSKPIRFTLKLRIPEWAENPRLSINGKAQTAPRPGSFHAITRTFSPGDRISLELPLIPRIIRPTGGGLTVIRDPLLYALKIKEKATARTDLRQTSPDYPAWDLTPDSPWNYALNPQDERNIKLHFYEYPDGSFPWDVETSPVTLSMPARRVENWTLTPDGKNPPLPEKDLKLSSQTEDIVLVPYGSTRLRWTVFPEAK